MPQFTVNNRGQLLIHQVDVVFEASGDDFKVKKGRLYEGKAFNGLICAYSTIPRAIKFTNYEPWKAIAPLISKPITQ